MQVRRAQLDDATAACQVVRSSIEQLCTDDHEADPIRIASWLLSKTPERFRSWILSDSLHCVVAVGDAGVVGFGMATAAGELLLCYVAPEVRFQGVGKAVLQAVERWAAATGITTLKLDSTKTALVFYQRNGFQSSGPVTVFAGMESQPMSKAIYS